MADTPDKDGIIICYSGLPVTTKDHAELLDPDKAEARWEAGVPINKLEFDKDGKPLPRKE